MSKVDALARHPGAVRSTVEGRSRMARYLCLQRALPGGAGRGRPSPTEMQKMYDAFQQWRARFQDALPDLGGRLGQGRLVTAEPAPDGPLVEVKELVGGYMIVTAGSLE